MGAWTEKRIFELDGGRLSLEFTNTMGGLRGVNPDERITGYADLAWWAQQVGLIDLRRMEELIIRAAAHPRLAAQAHAAAIEAREALHDVVLATLEEREPPSAALEPVNRWM